MSPIIEIWKAFDIGLRKSGQVGGHNNTDFWRSDQVDAGSERLVNLVEKLTGSDMSLGEAKG